MIDQNIKSSLKKLAFVQFNYQEAAETVAVESGCLLNKKLVNSSAV